MPTNPDELSSCVLHPLVERIQQGDQAASDELLRRCAGQLQALAHSMFRRYFPRGRPLDDTSDVLQNASLRLLSTLEAIRPNDTRHFFNLAALQIRLVLLDLLRTCKSRKPLSIFPCRQVLRDSPFWTLQRLMRKIEAWTCGKGFTRRSISSRPRSGRLWPCVYHGWTHAQIAELLGVTERTVRRSWNRACLTLTERLQGKLPELQ